MKRFSNRRLLVVGDLILDQFIWGRVNRISPEAPVPVIEVTKEASHLGGAANVVNNLALLGAKPLLVGITGKDDAGKYLLKELQQLNVDVEGIVQDPDRMTTVKTRILAQNQQICRTDRENRFPPKERVVKKLIELCDAYIDKADGIILSDYSKGVLSKNLMQEIIKKSRKKKQFLAVDPKMNNFSAYHGAYMVTPNTKEAEYASGIPITNESSLVAAGQKLLRSQALDYLLITRGKQGMTLFEGQNCSHIPTVAREVFDVTGAGDTVVAVLTLAVASGASVSEAAVLANHAAGVVVGKLGTAVASTEEILSSLGAD